MRLVEGPYTVRTCQSRTTNYTALGILEYVLKMTIQKRKHASSMTFLIFSTLARLLCLALTKTSLELVCPVCVISSLISSSSSSSPSYHGDEFIDDLMLLT